MGNGKGLGWLVQRDCYFLIEKALWSFSHPVGLMLYLLICLHFSSKTNTACSAPVQTVWFSPKLQRHAMLCIGYPPEDEASPVTEVTWKKKHGDEFSRILTQVKGQSPVYYWRYDNRTQYYFKNNTLILDNILEEDKGTYGVSLVYKNKTMWQQTLELMLIMPPPNPSIKVVMNNSKVTLVLRCEVESGINLSYHWLKSGQLVPQDERHSLIERNSTLEVNNVTSDDCVNYTCVAANGPVRSEGHIQLNGSVIKMCSPSAARVLTLKVILSITVAAICVFGVCILVLCFRHEIWQWLMGRNSDKQPATRRSECPVYEEIWEEQVLPAAEEVVQLVCVYTDFIPNCHGARSRQRPVPVEDFGYSTIEPQSPNST